MLTFHDLSLFFNLLAVIKTGTEDAAVPARVSSDCLPHQLSYLFFLTFCIDVLIHCTKCPTWCKSIKKLLNVSFMKE